MCPVGGGQTAGNNGHQINLSILKLITPHINWMIMPKLICQENGQVEKG